MAAKQPGKQCPKAKDEQNMIGNLHNPVANMQHRYIKYHLPGVDSVAFSVVQLTNHWLDLNEIWQAS